MPFIDYCIHCYKYERRLNWELSSILQQKSLPDMRIVITSLEGSRSNPDLGETISYFSSRGLDIQNIPLDRETFAKRGLARNVQIKKTSSPWLFFSDADNVYTPDFFEKLIEKLKGDCKDVTKCITSIHKKHTEIKATNLVVNKYVYPVEIFNVFKVATTIPYVKKTNKTVAAGCMQVVSRESIMSKDGIYINPRRTQDWHMFKIGQMARSDIQFRRKIGGSKLITLPKQIHLNHNRDKDYPKGVHLEEQR